MKILPSPRTRDEMLERHGERFKWLVLVVVATGTVAGVLSTSSFNVAVPALSRYFSIGQDKVQWAITGFMAAMTIAMLPTPWLLDRFGFRRMFLVAIVLMATTSVAGSLATSFSFVVVARVLQGAAAGLLQPLASLVVLRLFPVQSQGRASGLLSFGIVLAPAVAPSLGGVLLDHFGWQAIFLLNLPFCLLSGVLGLLLLPRPSAVPARKFDWIGVGLLCVATLATIEAVASLHHSGLSSVWTLSQFGVLLLCAALFAWHARRTAEPIIHFELFREPAFAMGTLVFFAYGFGLYASTYLIPVFLQSALGFAATAAGFALLPSGIALALVIPFAGMLADRFPPRWLTVGGLALFCLSFVLFALLSAHLNFAELVLVTVMGRVGLGLVIPALSLATLRHVSPHRLGQSSMVTSYARQVGGVVGIAVTAVFVESRMSAYGSGGTLQAYSDGFWLLAVAFACAVFAALRMTPRAVD